MNREEYLKRLSFLLKDLPEEEIEDAIAYYEDYFEEAGEENEEQVIKELGSPEKIARMIRDSVQGNQASSEYTEEGYRQELMYLDTLILKMPTCKDEKLE